MLDHSSKATGTVVLRRPTRADVDEVVAASTAPRRHCADATGSTYAAIVVDWRMPNLLSSRFWPARGFPTSFARLHRSIR